uniref:Uncharacterized protein n=1 Tax=Hyaloperonospora arabidopsidis (strain Emoy2) TaxID=559515 RepID=M4C3P9_HYAAE
MSSDDNWIQRQRCSIRSRGYRADRAAEVGRMIVVYCRGAGVACHCLHGHDQRAAGKLGRPRS